MDRNIFKVSAPKHLFYVHSYITYLVALKVMEVEKINKAHVVFIVNRGIQVVDEELQYYRIDKFCTYEATAISKYFWRSWKLLSNIDSLIGHVTLGKPFYFYTPHSIDNFMQIVITNKKCLGFSYLEEGSAAYYDIDYHNLSSFSSLQKFNRFLNYGNRMPNFKFYEPFYLKAYGIYKYSFPDFERRVELGNVFSGGIRERGFDNAHILVFDGLVEFKQVSMADYLCATQKVINYLKVNGVKKIYYKLHPEQLKSKVGTGTNIKSILQECVDIKFQELPEDTILENIAACNANVSFYIFLSSVGFYAAMNGHKVFSFISAFDDGRLRLLKKVEALPKAYTEKIIQI